MPNMNVLMTNTSALFANRQVGITNRNKEKSIEKLSSGYKINRGADDAAGLTISEKMRFYIRGLNQGVSNIQDGVSLCQVADGALNEIHDMLHRMNELAVKSANGTNTDEDREAIDAETRGLKDEITRILETTEFNEFKIFDVPYIPNVSGTPGGLVMFNEKLVNGEVKYGGVEINNIRHRWSEIGIDKYISADGHTINIPSDEDDDPDDDIISKDIKFTLNDGSGETVRLRLIDGTDITDISRVYEWSADNDGIKINNLKAASWSDLGVTDKGKEDGIISFEHKGITYTVKTDDDNKKDIISGINGHSLNTDGIFTASATAVSHEEAVEVTNGIATVTFTGSNKKLLDDDYSISANSTGITLNRIDRDGDSSGVSARTIKWSEFKDVNTGKYPIRDFGLYDNDNSAGTSTFDSSATYHYADNGSGIEFDFILKDESSFDGIRNGLNGSDIKEKYYAPGTVTIVDSATDSHGGSVVLRNQYIGGNSIDNVRAQKAIGRNFDNANATVDITVKKSIAASGGKTNVNNTYGSLNKDNGSIVHNYETKDEDVYIARGDGTYTKYKQTSVYGTVNGQQTMTSQYSQAYSINYSASAPGASLKTNPPSGSITANYRDTYQLSGTYKFLERYEYDAGTVVNGEDLPDGATILSEKKVNPGDPMNNNNLELISQTSTRTGHELISAPSVSNNVSISASNGVKLLDLTVSTTSAGIESGYTEEYKLRFTAQDKASVTFTASEKGAAAGNIALVTPMKKFDAIQPKKYLDIQAGDDADNVIEMEWWGMNLTTLGISNTSMLTEADARGAINEIKDALSKVSSTRSRFGAYQNKLEHAINQNKNTAENLTAAESRIRDTDMAEESVRFAKENILAQAGMSMLAQANQQKQGIANLLQ